MGLTSLNADPVKGEHFEETKPGTQLDLIEVERGRIATGELPYRGE